MPTLIKDGQVIDNPWCLLEKGVDLNAALSDKAEQIVVPFALWQDHKDSLMESSKKIAVWLDSEDDPYELANDVIDLPLICLNFPGIQGWQSLFSGGNSAGTPELSGRNSRHWGCLA